METTADLGTLLSHARRLTGKPLHAVAAAAQISTAYLAKLEKGQIRSPSPNVLFALAGALNLEYLDLMRATGYVVPGAPEHAGDAVSALRSAGLTPAELDAVVRYAEFLRSQRDANDKEAKP